MEVKRTLAVLFIPVISFGVSAGVGHVSKCISYVDCVTFLYQDGKFDFVPVNP